MKNPRLALFVLCLMTALFVSTAPAEDLPKLKYEKFTLSNGLDVILYEDHTIPMVTVNVYYHVGSKDEEIGKTGYAHLFEHMMFQQSEHHNAMFDEDIDVYGGVNNGGTNSDGTRYWETMPSNYLEKTLWLEADRMGYLLPALSKERLDNQISVVVNEKRENYIDQPYGLTGELLHEMLYPPHHPYHWLTIGYVEDLQAATMDDIRAFFQKYYAPNNASLCIAGDFDPVQAKEWVQKYFGPIPSGPKIARVEQWVPVLNGEIRYSYEDQIQLPRIYMCWNTPPSYGPGDAEFDLLAGVLTGGESARLYKHLVYDRQIAQDVAAFQVSMELGSYFQIQVTAKEGVSLVEIERNIDSILNDIMTNGVSVEEFELSRTNWEASFVRQMENISGFGGLADKMNSYNLFHGEPDLFNWDRARYTATTIPGMLKYMREYIQKDKRVVLTVYPKAGLSPAQMATDMSINPGPAAKPSFTPPTIQTTTLANGMTLYLVEKHDLPLVQLDLLFKSGWDCDPADRPGSSSLTAELISEGTKTKNAMEISDAFQTLGTNFSVTSGWDNTIASLNTLKKNLDASLALMADIIINPTFPQEELDRQRQIYLGRIKQEMMQPFAVGLKGYYRELYGEKHPYGQPYTGSGTEESITAITRTDIEKYYRDFYVPNNASVLVSGDITLAEAKAKLENIFKKWKTGTVPATTIQRVPALEKTKIVIIDKPGAAQSAIFAGNLFESRQDPEFIEATVVVSILGGGGTDRLFQNLRTDKGYTYGAYAFVSSRKGQGALTCYSQVQGDKTAESVFEFVKELRGITGEIPITEKELDDGRNNLANGYPQRFQTIGGITGQLGTLVTYGLPMDYWGAYMGRVNSVDMEKAMKVANRVTKPEALLIVVVGDRQKIEAGLRDLNLGEVVLSSTN